MKKLQSFNFKRHFRDITVNDTISVYFGLKMKSNSKLSIKDSYGSARIYAKKYQAKAYKKHADLLKDEIKKVLFEIPNVQLLNKKLDKYAPRHSLNFLFKIDVENDNKITLLNGNEHYEGGFIERTPLYPGCETEFPRKKSASCFQLKIQNHIRRNFKYPKEAQKLGIQGRVYINFLINKEGDIENIRMRGPHPFLKAEARRIIELLPKFSPGLRNGEPVKVPFSIPITFRLQ
ncbi:TonB family protein [Spongiivirga citrea]|uniref:TonB family protein n=2 Tax=Spongiivirga citrea TaxID=1481457 RepID=A0A6M0CTJ4_9FLAO|nr:TonB family protein [Spongiivirga citrea]